MFRGEMYTNKWSRAMPNKAPDPIYDPLRIFLSQRVDTAYDHLAYPTRPLQRFHELYPLMPDANLRLSLAQTRNVIKNCEIDELSDKSLEDMSPDAVAKIEARIINIKLMIEGGRRAGLIDAPRTNTTLIGLYVEKMTFASQHIESAISIWQDDPSRSQDVAILKAFKQRALEIAEEIRARKTTFAPSP